MRNLLSIALAISICSFAGPGWAQTGSAQGDTASLTTSSSNLPDDPAFAEYLRVTPGIKPPRATSAPDPKFPDLPADAEPRGTVVLLIGVNTKGHVQAVRVLRSDHQVFEKSAVDTVRKWKFKPAEKDGHPVPVQVTVEMKFQK
jgi:TonB family protein